VFKLRYVNGRHQRRQNYHINTLVAKNIEIRTEKTPGFKKKQISDEHL